MAILNKKNKAALLLLGCHCKTRAGNRHGNFRNSSNCIFKCDNITYPQHYSQQHPNYRPAGGRCGFGHHSRPIPKSIQLRSKQAIIGIHWSYNHELHTDGAS